MITLAPFEERHQEGVFSLILGIQQQEFGIPITRDDQPDLAQIPSFYQQQGGNFWVALDGGNVVGTIGLKSIGDRKAALRKMFVSQPHRGRQHQVAQRLLETLLLWSRTNRFQGIYLGTTAKFLAAHRFYEKHGFRELAREELPANFPVMTVDTKFYTLSLE